MESNFLIEVAKKLNVSDKKTINKANELINILESRPPLSCSESCKIVVCLELASSLSQYGGINRENAIKYSGCKRPLYVNMFNTISKIVNLDRVLSVKELCLNLGVSEGQSMAQKILDCYKKVEDLSKEQLEHPMLPCAAVLAACRISKIKLNLKPLVETSRIKKPELELLSKSMETISECKNDGRGKKRNIEKSIVQKKVQNEESVKEPKKLSKEEKEEEYLNWKKRMLAE